MGARVHPHKSCANYPPQKDRGFARGCVKNALVERDAVPEMKEDPSEPACRSRLQTAVSCCRPMAVVVNVHGKGATYASCAGWRDERKQTTAEASKGFYNWHQNRSVPGPPGRAWRIPGYWPCGVRGTGGVTPVRALVRNLRTCSAVLREKAQAEDPRGRKYQDSGQGRTAP